MGAIITGWLLIIIGVLFLLLGLAAAAQQVILRRQRLGSEEGLEDVHKILEIFVALIRELSKAPQWLALTIIGLILIIIGSTWAF